MESRAQARLPQKLKADFPRRHDAAARKNLTAACGGVIVPQQMRLVCAVRSRPICPGWN
jgi:hypothetical protein